MQTSVAPQVEQALLARWQARPGLADVLVDAGPMGVSGTTAGKYIQTGARLDPGPSITAGQAWGTLGNLRREEDVTIDCLIWVELDGNGGQVTLEASALAFDLLSEVEQSLREDVTLGGLVTAVELQALVEQRFVATGTRTSVIPFTVRYRATLPLG